MSNIPEAYSIESNTFDKTILNTDDVQIDEIKTLLKELEFFSDDFNYNYKSRWKINNDLLYYLNGSKAFNYYEMTFRDGSTKGEINNPDPRGYKTIYVKIRKKEKLEQNELDKEKLEQNESDKQKLLELEKMYQQILELNKKLNQQKLELNKKLYQQKLKQNESVNRITFVEAREDNFDAIKKCVNKRLLEDFVFLERKDKNEFIEVFIELYDVEENKQDLVDKFNYTICNNDTKSQGGARNKSKKIKKIKKSKKSKKSKKTKKNKKSKSNF